VSELACAPVSWGVWERTVDRDDLISHDELLRLVASLGYGALELGPLGYLGRDAEAVRRGLESHALELVGGFVSLHLTDEDSFAASLLELEGMVAILAEYPTAVALLADGGSPERARSAGKPRELSRTGLSGSSLDRAAARLEQAAERCNDRGVPAALHPEVSSYIESPSDVEAFLGRVDPALLGLCFDAGHVLVGGGNPVCLARDWGERISHVHLKDVSGYVLQQLRAGTLDVDAAWADGLFCAFGEGEVDLANVLAAPAIRGAPWIVLEQDRIAVTRPDIDRVRAVELRNLEFVRARLAAD
jgi:inosose dehydratase